jgi:hypothetical protein
MDADAHALQKIRDPGMRDLAAEGAESSVDVLIELDLPLPSLHLERSLLRVGRPALTIKDAPDENFKDAFDQFGEYLNKKSTRSPTALHMAHAYVVTLPAKSLIEIAGNPIVSSILPNRRLVVG